MAVRYGPAAVFLDKDGTLLADEPYNVDPNRMQFASGAAAALRRLGALDRPLIVVTNQPGVALNRFKPSALEAVEQRLAELFADCGASLSGFYYCPHHPCGLIPELSFDCLCRKPLPGMLQRAAHEHGIDLSQSWMVGDILDDVEAGRRAGCRTIMVDCGNETEWATAPATLRLRAADFTVANLERAACIIAGQMAPRSGLSACRSWR
jgi:histidinol-phosphate phosphatase family protein